MTDDSLTVAVTGVGAIIGQGIIRSLRVSGYRVRIVGIDRNPHSPGTHMCDVFEAKPAADESGSEYLDFWERIIKAHRVALVLPGLELDMHFLNRQRAWFGNAGARLGLNAAELIERTGNKWSFGLELASIGYPLIPSVRPENWKEAVNSLGPAPLLLKPLQGNGSRGIVRLEDERDFEYWKSKLRTPWMLQRIVGSDDEEYTVGIFGLGDGRYVGPMMFRRRLSSAGNTLEAEVVRRHELLETAVEGLCKHFTPIGPTNLQFRLEGDTPYLLEINPRFSSSNSLRTAFGFNEAEMAVNYYVHGHTPDAPVLKDGVAWRYTEDFVLHAGDTV
ncbi:MAG: ATP-grasp domain-containing protein [Propionivibrio sp.]